MAIIGGIIIFIGFVGVFIFWIMTLVRQFKSGDTVWGVLSIFFGILAPIWAFMNGHKKLGINFVIAFVILLIGYAVFGAGMVSQIQNLEGMEGLSAP